jgi:hypothetical protein
MPTQYRPPKGDHINHNGPTSLERVKSMTHWIVAAFVMTAILALDTSAYGETRKGSGTISGVIDNSTGTTYFVDLGAVKMVASAA